MSVSLVDLEKELIEAVSSLHEFKDKGYAIYSIEDLERLAANEHAQLPIVGVGYDGAERQGNQAQNVATGSRGAAFVSLQFVIIVAVSYASTGGDDHKSSAMELLGSIREKVIGLKGANSRGWHFIGERPEPEASGDGVIFYSQVWQTSAPLLGNNF